MGKGYRFCQLNKAQKEAWLPQLFDLLHENMRLIAPSGLSYADEKALWLSQVSPALEKAPRQIILCFSGEELAGFLQYYTCQELLVVEEVQLKEAFQGTFLFFRLCKFLASVLPEGLHTLAAYADKRNGRSIRLMEKLGMVPDPEGQQEAFLCMGGPIQKILPFFER